MAGKGKRLNGIVAICGTVTAVAGAIAGVLALVPRDSVRPLSATIQNVVSVPGAQTAPRGRAGESEWPGGAGFTAVVASRPSEAEARLVQRQASDRGLDAGVLRSDRFRSLKPGYWVVFSGRWASEAEAAQRAARALTLGFAGAYPRFVSP